MPVKDQKEFAQSDFHFSSCKSRKMFAIPGDKGKPIPKKVWDKKVWDKKV